MNLGEALLIARMNYADERSKGMYELSERARERGDLERAVEYTSNARQFTDIANAVEGELWATGYEWSDAS